MKITAPPGHIATFSGKFVDPFNLSESDICIHDIAHALALKCRFGGHCKRFYSVAEHSVLVSLECETAPLWGLLHDAAEAYLPDIAAPIKHHVPLIIEAENRILATVAKKWSLGDMPPEVHAADQAMLVSEARTLMPVDWTSDSDVYSKMVPAPNHWKIAEILFLDRFNALTGEPV